MKKREQKMIRDNTHKKNDQRQQHICIEQRSYDAFNMLSSRRLSCQHTKDAN